MPRKVMTFQGIADVPTNEEMFQQIGYINQNKQEIWNAINQLKRNPAADISSECRALREAAFSAQKQLNGPLPDDGWHVWKCIDVGGKRLDALEKGLDVLGKRLDAIQSDAARAFRGALDETLRPIFQYGLDQAIRRLVQLEDENRALHAEIREMETKLSRLETRILTASAGPEPS